MRVRTVVWSSLVVVLALGPAESSARATPGSRCLAVAAKAGARYVKKLVTLERKCREANLRFGCGTCAAPEPTAVAKLEANLTKAIIGHCALTPFAFGALGFPGPCGDPTPGDPFTPHDFATCVHDRYTAQIHGICVGGTSAGLACTSDGACAGSGATCVGLFGVEYDDGVVCGGLTREAFACQREIGRSGLRFVLKVLQAVGRCRNDLLTGKRIGVEPDQCATQDERARTLIAAARADAEERIAARCDVAALAPLAACTPDQSTPQGPACDPTVAGCTACVGAAQCETCWHQALADDPRRTDPFDLIDYVYPPAPPSDCGNGIVDDSDEECDGPDDAACPGECGPPDGCFGCLCQNRPRQCVTEHRDADLDLGFSGLTHDAHVVEGGGFVADLYDCDGPSGPDTLCTVGPSCSAGGHSPCSPLAAELTTGDALCQARGEGTCRRTRAGSQGRHCEIDFDRRCVTSADCPGGQRCVERFHGAPLPLSAGGISVCSVNYFTEDVTGTTDLATGASSVRIRQRSVVYGPGDVAQPCPVCGGFCEAPAGGSPGGRTKCASDDDCLDQPPHHCVTAHVCSYGPNADQPCRADPPFGGSAGLFGNPSVDCVPPPGTNISGPGLDILFDPAATDTVSRTATVHCTDNGFTNKACIGGTSDGRPCAVASECPLGVCNEQCFCPASGNGQPTRPNACLPACKGGANDAESCFADDDCPGGFCHRGDCRVDAGDTDSCQEGVCTTGPIQGFCSETQYRPCTNNAGCAAPLCPDCRPGETCTLRNRACFVNGTIERCGAPGLPDRTTATIFCIPAVNASTVNVTSGLPGPGALTQPLSTVEVGF